MSLAGSSLSSAVNCKIVTASKKAFSYGRTDVVKPKGKHQATIVWLHGLGDEVYGWSTILESLPLPNIKWICPTAPERPVTLFGGFPSTAWFDISEISENGKDDVEGLDATAAYVSSLLATEPPDIKLAIGGFSMGAAASLHSATCFVHGKYHNGKSYPTNLSAIVGLSGWLPCASTLSPKIEGVENAASLAASLPIMLCHGKSDNVVPYKFGDKSSQKLISAGFCDVTFKSYSGLGHHTLPEETDNVCKWLTTKLGLDGK
ncbi:hypothetical protein Leryth_024547 [Lithospermum erythrorhizon]|nr:hypothetical protein Leryth_024547 [Lithospermum erythrorhizon]